MPPQTRDLLIQTAACPINKKSQSQRADLSPDGRWLAIAYRTFGSHDVDNGVLIWDVRGRQISQDFLGCTGNVDDLAFSPDGKQLVCVGGAKQHFMGGEVAVWNTRTWKVQRRIAAKETPSLRSVALSSDGRWMATGSAVSGGDEKKVHLWDAANGTLVRTFADLGNDVSSLAFSPDSKNLAAGVASKRTASLWSIPSGKERWTTRAHSEASRLRVRFSPDGKLLATCGDRNVALWNVATGKRHAILKGHGRDVASIAFSRDGKYLVSSAFCEAIVWDLATLASLGMQTLPRESSYLPFLSFVEGDGEMVGLHSINDEIAVLYYRCGEFTRPVSQVAPVGPLVRTAAERKLIEQIVAEPDQDGPRLRYADWLEKRSDPRGEFIRVQCALSDVEELGKPTAKEGGRVAQLRKRQKALLETHFAEWTAAIGELTPTPETAEFRRGMLYRLELRSIDVTDDSLKCLAKAPEIEELVLEGSSVTDGCLEHLKSVVNLRSLSATETKITPVAFKRLKSLQRLVRIYNGDWGNKRLEEAETWKAARNKRFLELPPSERRSEAIRALRLIVGYLPRDERGQYTRVSYSQSWASDGDLHYLVALPEVEELDFFECRAVTSKGMKHLWGLKNLRTLRLTESGVFDFAPLARLKQLQALEADSQENLDPSSLRALAKLKHLQQLTLRFCNQTDAIMPHLAKLSELRELDIIYNDISDDALRLLLNLKKLEKLEVDCRDKQLVEEILRR
jgi:uncharacterized protein (TIGR02996 family)